MEGWASPWLVVLLWICSVYVPPCHSGLTARLQLPRRTLCEIKPCLTGKKTLVIVAGIYTGIMNDTTDNRCDISYSSRSTAAEPQNSCRSAGFWLKSHNGSSLLYVSKRHLGLSACVVLGRHCNLTNVTDLTAQTPPVWYPDRSGNCTITCFNIGAQCGDAKYNKTLCSRDALFDSKSKNKDKYIITTRSAHCVNCNNPVKVPMEEIRPTQQFEATDIDIDPVKAAEVMEDLSSLVSQMNESSASVSMGTVTGVLVKQQDHEDIQEVFFGFSSNPAINIVDGRDDLTEFSTTVSVSKEAFEMAYNSSNGSPAFAGVFRFPNMAKDEDNSSVLNNEVLAIEMGAVIERLTDPINISYRSVNKKEANPSCHSWDGKGRRPNWTDAGCKTIQDGDGITCQCTHLTFFAVLMAPPNISISSADLSSLSYVTAVGCGISLFFLFSGLFMHCLMRRCAASQATQILMNLFLAMSLLDLCFLINEPIAHLGSAVGCQIMAGCMHYSMLATFTWFAMEAFHLCLQLHQADSTSVHYVLKVCTVGWVLPGVFVVVLGSLGKYGQLVINTDGSKDVSMCWITDVDVHYIVNIGYYALVFLFTFTVFIAIVRWLFILKSTGTGANGKGTRSKNIVTISGLCCMLGITWCFAFTAYGDLAVPSYYVFSILNSFQGFFLFLYYYNTSQIVGDGGTRDKSSSTINTTTAPYKNPYDNLAVNQPGN